jgi:hypothetical protein
VVTNSVGSIEPLVSVNTFTVLKISQRALDFDRFVGMT